MKKLKIEGLQFNNADNADTMIKLPLVVRYTKDKVGKTLSISNEKDTMFIVPFEEIEKMIKGE